jgi:hypothetical protein
LKFCRKGFDLASRYNPDKMTENQWLTRIIFLETIAGVPGFVGAMNRHMRSLRTLNRDNGWIHYLLEEAENERMHLFVFLNEAKPSWIIKMFILFG